MKKDNFVFIGDIIEENGKTIKENNLEKKHKIPLGTLVEVNIEDSEYDKMRMYIVHYNRDCDGTPLYCLSHKNGKIVDWKSGATQEERIYKLISNSEVFSGFSDSCLTIIK